MNTTSSTRQRYAGILLGVLALVAVGALMPHASAQIKYTEADDPHGPLQSVAWAAGMAVVGVMAGIGVYTTVRRPGH